MCGDFGSLMKHVYGECAAMEPRVFILALEKSIFGSILSSNQDKKCKWQKIDIFVTGKILAVDALLTYQLKLILSNTFKTLYTIIICT